MAKTTKERGGGASGSTKRMPPNGKKFTSENQPSAKAKSEGHKRKKFTRDLIKEILNMPYKFPDTSQVKQQLIAAFGPAVEVMNAGEIATLMQVHKAVLKGDSYSYNTVIDQALGRPVQAIAETDPEGNALKPVKLTPPKGMKFNLPQNVDGEE